MSVINNPTSSGGGGGSSTVGTSTLNFGSFPGTPMASVAVTGQASILTTSSVEAWLSPSSGTSDHGVDEHRIENIKITAGNLVAGTGFTIYGEVKSPVDNNGLNGSYVNNVYGQWTINWRWQ